jgi:hypothetical protein
MLSIEPPGRLWKKSAAILLWIVMVLTGVGGCAVKILAVD